MRRFTENSHVKYVLTPTFVSHLRLLNLNPSFDQKKKTT